MNRPSKKQRDRRRQQQWESSVPVATREEHAVAAAANAALIPVAVMCRRCAVPSGYVKRDDLGQLWWQVDSAVDARLHMEPTALTTGTLAVRCVHPGHTFEIPVAKLRASASKAQAEKVQQIYRV